MQKLSLSILMFSIVFINYAVAHTITSSSEIKTAQQQKKEQIQPVQYVEQAQPNNFIDIKQVIPQVQVDIRYATNYNFVGRKINGYQASVCLLTKQAASALKIVEEQLLPMGLTIKVYDCYRPQRAVNDFMNWATFINDAKMRTEFYPTINKKNLFRDGYIAAKSGHSRGSTVDLTIVPISSTIPDYSNYTGYTQKQRNCNLPKAKRNPDNSLDLGTGFDCFSPNSHLSYSHLTAQVNANKKLLKDLMLNAGFKPLEEEWWHFTLINEPYPNTYFDFPITNNITDLGTTNFNVTSVDNNCNDNLNLLKDTNTVDIPQFTKQLIIVKPDKQNKSKAILYTCERYNYHQINASQSTRQGNSWYQVFNPFNAVLGVHGIAKKGMKEEGDGMTPSGVFSIGEVFGYSPIFELNYLKLKMDYRYIANTKDKNNKFIDKFINDSSSPAYNSWVVGSSVGSDVNNASGFEEMRNSKTLYELGIIINYNMNPTIPNKGSAIFIHKWRSANKYTDGCVAIDKPHLIELIKWLDKAMQPKIVILVPE